MLTSDTMSILATSMLIPTATGAPEIHPKSWPLHFPFIMHHHHRSSSKPRTCLPIKTTQSNPCAYLRSPGEGEYRILLTVYPRSPWRTTCFLVHWRWKTQDIKVWSPCFPCTDPRVWTIKDTHLWATQHNTATRSGRESTSNSPFFWSTNIPCDVWI